MLIEPNPSQANSHNFPHNLSLWPRKKRWLAPDHMLEIHRNLKNLIKMCLLSTYYIMDAIVDTRGTVLGKSHTVVSLFMAQGRR